MLLKLVNTISRFFPLFSYFLYSIPLFFRRSVSSIVLCYCDSLAKVVYHMKQIIFLTFFASRALFPVRPCTFFVRLCVVFFICFFFIYILYSWQIKRLAIILGTILAMWQVLVALSITEILISYAIAFYFSILFQQ